MSIVGGTIEVSDSHFTGAIKDAVITDRVIRTIIGQIATELERMRDTGRLAVESPIITEHTLLDGMRYTWRMRVTP